MKLVVEIIQALVPLSSMHVEEGLQAEVDLQVPTHRSLRGLFLSAAPLCST